MDDEKIIELFWQRSEMAIQETSEKYGKLCTSIARNILHDHSDVEECINDAYLRVWNAIPPTRPKDFQAFLCKIVRNVSLTRYRYNHRAKRGGDTVTVLLSELEECFAGVWNVEEAIDNVHITSIINDFLEKISPVNRVIFVRRYWYADSIETIANLCGTKESQVKVSLHRSRKRLKKELEKGGIWI